MIRCHTIIITFILFGYLQGGLIRAEESPPSVLSSEDLVSFTLKSPILELIPEETVSVVIKAELVSGWYIRSLQSLPNSTGDATQLTFQFPEGFQSEGPLVESPHKSKPSRLPGKVVLYHEGHAWFSQKVRIPQEERLEGEGTIGIEIEYQVCSSRKCYAPEKKTLTALWKKGKGSHFSKLSTPLEAKASSPSLIQSQTDGSDFFQETFWQFIGLAVLTGLLTIFTPCIFPIIPLTISFFLYKSEASRFRTLKRVLVFTIGIVGTFTITGMLMSGMLGASGAIELVTNPWINLLFGLILMSFGFSLMGFLQIQIPGEIKNYFDQKARKASGILSGILMGLAFTITSLSCTVQFIGTLLIVSSQGHWMWPIIGMVVYSLTLSAPFLLLALFPGWINTFRGRAGVWLLQLKFVLGMVEIAASIKFFSNADLLWQFGVIDREIVLTIWMIIALIVAFFILGSIRIRNIAIESVGGIELIAGMFFLFIVLFLSQGWLGNPLPPQVESFLPPALSATENRMPNKISESASQSSLRWYENWEEARQQSLLRQKPLFVDFTGYTCVNCRWMEQKIFSLPRVQDEFETHFVLVKLYTDGGNDYQKNRDLLLKRFRSLALPTYAVISPTDELLAQYSGIFSTVDEFMEFLENARKKQDH